MSASRLYYARHKELWKHLPLQNEDLAHDTEHVLRVYRWAVQLAAESEVDPDLAGAAALLHDLINLPKESPDRALASEKSAQEGKQYLTAVGYTEEEQAIIIEGIRTASWSRGLQATNGVGAVLQDADRLDAIEA